MRNNFEQFQFLKNCFEQKLPHSWIFYGPKGVGKYEFTIELIKNVNKVKNPNHIIYEINNPDKPALIDDIREFISQSKLTNSSSSKLKSFFLIHQIEMLNLNCMNALLKTIEEPPENTIIIIFAQNLRNIPKTILSRCLQLRFKSMDCELFIDKKSVKKENFLICNYNPKVFNILNDKKGEEIKQKTMMILKENNLELNQLYALNQSISENFFTYFTVILSIIFYDLKSKISSQFFDSDKIKKALIYLDFVKNISINEIKIDKKKALHLIFSEYFRYNLNN